MRTWWRLGWGRRGRPGRGRGDWTERSDATLDAALEAALEAELDAAMLDAKRSPLGAGLAPAVRPGPAPSSCDAAPEPLDRVGDQTSPCGWFESSFDLRCGLAVVELHGEAASTCFT